jgi:pyridoxamine 5'-phosphate oxidase
MVDLLNSQLSQALRTLRREHEDAGIDVGDLHDDPLVELGVWMQMAIDANLPLPNAMILATADTRGRPSARVTLLKGVDDRGLVFFSNYESRKGRELISNPHAAVVLYWGPLGRQVRIEGPVERISEAESFDYFQTRSRGSRIGAWASPQSQVIESRAALDALVADTESRYPDEDVPLPPHWGGFRLTPEQVEFWNGRPNRLHDRIVYTPDGAGGWKKQRLAP